MNQKLAAAAAVLLAMAALPEAAHAHVDREAGLGFVTGLLHPILGIDHFLAMLSVGIVSAQLGGRRIFTVPAMFVLAMVGGAVFGIQGYEWPLTEVGIALSVVVLGVAIATVDDKGRGWPVAAILGVVALFGSLHGHAHGLELPGSAEPVYYGAGFVLSTSAIHLLGVGIGHLFTSRVSFLAPLRHMGSAMAGMGLMILLELMSAG